MIYWDIPFTAGELVAEGYDKNGKLQASYTIKTSGRPYTLRATLLETETQPREAIAKPTFQILVEVLDEEGTLVKLADNMVNCRVQGPARLLGLENSDNSDMSRPKAPQRRVYQGYLVAYVQAVGDKEEPVTVTFTSPLIGEAVIELK